ncbi:MAG: hypothetical protein GC208_10515 [Alphaproteobacteria bacterium]|nr:hypothetical protein [Alphaproteobacteria bacterium]
MASVGLQKKLTAFSLALESEVMDGFRKSRNSAIQAILTLLTGDVAYFGNKRAAFRYVELCAQPSDPPSMSVLLSNGSAIVNDGENHNGNWYLIFGQDLSITVSASTSVSLDRYDILCIVPKLTGQGSIQREVVDAEGRVSLMTDQEYLADDFQLHIIKGQNGAAAPEITRVNAHTFTPPGMIPVALIKVRAGTDTIELADLTDLRETFTLRNYAGEASAHSDIAALNSNILVPNYPNQPFILLDADNATDIPYDSFYIDKSAGSPGTLKYRKGDGSVVSLG